MPNKALARRNVPPDLQNTILLIRGQKVILDSDIARLYGVETRVLIQAMKRNKTRFPDDFVFQLNTEEAEGLRSQFVISNTRGGRRYAPYAFTEHGVAMLSAVLSSPMAVRMSIHIVRAFVRIRELMSANRELASRIEALELGQREHSSVIAVLAQELSQFLRAPEQPKRRIGFPGPLALAASAS